MECAEGGWRSQVELVKNKDLAWGRPNDGGGSSFYLAAADGLVSREHHFAISVNNACPQRFTAKAGKYNAVHLVKDKVSGSQQSHKLTEMEWSVNTQSDLQRQCAHRPACRRRHMGSWACRCKHGHPRVGQIIEESQVK